MSFTRYDVLLDDARKRGYAVGAFNIFALEFLPAILSTAEEEKSPVLLQINPIHYPLADTAPYIEYVKTQIAKCRVPVGLNLDHGAAPEVVLKGIQYGFPSVMFDGSKLPYQMNLDTTKALAQICRSLDVTLEAELGTLNDEGLELTQGNQDKLFTDPDKAAEFVQASGVNALAVSIGNAHGFYKGVPKLDFNRLSGIAQKTNIPLVLHGGSGISDADLQKAISLGIHKINIYTEMSAAAWEQVNTTVRQSDGYHDYPQLLLKARSAVKEVVRSKMRVFGSSGKA
jgi:fructose-bisphosphate aldolase, class II